LAACSFGVGTQDEEAFTEAQAVFTVNAEAQLNLLENQIERLESIANEHEDVVSPMSRQLIEDVQEAYEEAEKSVKVAEDVSVEMWVQAKANADEKIEVATSTYDRAVVQLESETSLEIDGEVTNPETPQSPQTPPLLPDENETQTEPQNITGTDT
jgi:multidrug resistance efflux pump